LVITAAGLVHTMCLDVRVWFSRRPAAESGHDTGWTSDIGCERTRVSDQERASARSPAAACCATQQGDHGSEGALPFERWWRFRTDGGV